MSSHLLQCSGSCWPNALDIYIYIYICMYEYIYIYTQYTNIFPTLDENNLEGKHLGTIPVGSLNM